MLKTILQSLLQQYTHTYSFIIYRQKDMEFEKVIGLEIHMRIKSQSKMFCGCKNALELTGEPNTNVCPVCM